MKKLVVIAILFPFLVFSQKAALSKADKKYNNFEYIEAIKIYETIVKKGKGTPEIFFPHPTIAARSLFIFDARFIVKFTPFRIGQDAIGVRKRLEPCLCFGVTRAFVWVA